MNTRFWKMSGAGNDFIVIEGLLGLRGRALARILCDRHSGIGADGLLGLSRTRSGARIDYWNADGSLAFCGNGTRCGALWARAQGWVKGDRFDVQTIRGILDVRLTGKNRAEVSMPEPKGWRLRLRVNALKRMYTVHFVDTGVPHAVLFVADIARVDVKSLGRALRFHRSFGRSGANVDFVQMRGKTILLRTYERGVEDETLACGTGIVAAAAMARALHRVGDKVKVQVKSGDTLQVSFDGADTRLEGPGVVTFRGEVSQ